MIRPKRSEDCSRCAESAMARRSSQVVPAPDVAAFLVEHTPTVLPFDLSIPTVPTGTALWPSVSFLTSGVPFVVTTSNKAALESVVGSTDAIELTGTSENLTMVTAAILAAQR